MKQDNLFKQYKGVFETEDEPQKSSDRKNEKGRVFGYSPFALQDALGERSAKKAWIEYEKLRFESIEAEELIHKIISKIRDMAAIKTGATKEILGMKNYPFNKSKRDLKNWKEKELKDLYTKLVEAYHNSRMRGNDLDAEIEKIILSI